MKTSFTVKYIGILGILMFGFLGGYLYCQKTQTAPEELVACADTLQKSVADLEQCKEKFGECVYFLQGVLQEVQKRGLK